MTSLILCNYCFCSLTKLLLKHHKPVRLIPRFHQSKVLCSSDTDVFVQNLVLERGIKQEINISNYFESITAQNLFKETLSNICCKTLKLGNFLRTYDVQELVCCIEKEIDTKNVPNEKLIFLLIYFMKDANINGVKAIQSIVQKQNLVYYKNQAEYKHYLAEAFWLSGERHTSINLFSIAYDNTFIRPKVKVMLPNLFPLLTAQESDASLCKVITDIERFSIQKRDDLILACLWRELFMSTWFSDQEQASKLLLKNNHLIKVVKWMIPSMGKILLKSHRIEDFHRLIQFSLENELKSITASSVRLLFEYYYIHQNIERCTAVVKYSSNLGSCLTKDQQNRYIGLLLKSKNADGSKLIIKKPQSMEFKF